MDIVQSIARTLFVNAWADREEELGRSHGGQELFDIAPKTSRAAQDDAWRLVGMFEALNHMNIWAISAKVLKGAGLPDNEKNQAELGYLLTMEALGHGVSWMDDHDDHGLEVPDFEFHI
jgi:hypothetical protein